MNAEEECEELLSLTEFEVLSLIAIRSDLHEGPEGVRHFLREVYRYPGLGTRKVAQKVGLPLPVAVAVRNELERIGLCRGKGGIRLSECGRTFVEQKMGIRVRTNFLCPRCMGSGMIIPHEVETIKQQMLPYFKMRGPPNTTIDQAFATPETSLKRAIFVCEHDCIEGRQIIFLGDGDLTSLPITLFGGARRLTVLDIDPRVGRILEQFNQENSTEIEFVLHDLRNCIPEHLRTQYDVVLTDPPYTLPGADLFLLRSLECLKSDTSGSIFLSFVVQSPENALKLHTIFVEKELIIQQIIPGFNIYEGARIIGSRSNFYHLVTAPSRREIAPQKYEGKLYTGEIRETFRIYRCKCNAEIEVGASSSIPTIEALKTHGCPTCGAKKGFRMMSRVPFDPPSENK
ncbi:MAG: bis-aminopropyl spermidine synthase family protein [Candidatus Heimdallarchaeota archaeon]